MNKKSLETELILASTSPYRKMLLQRLGLAFSVMAPEMDESVLPGENAEALTARLALGKASSIAEQHPQALVIGCDQVADFSGTILGKPGTVDLAIAQLMLFSGKTIRFSSAICLMRQEPSLCEQVTIPTLVHFREFSEAEANRYVQLDMPLDCAGSLKTDAAGSVLLRGLESTDPTALIGLPLIALSGMLRTAGLELP
jgi:septum formation protein